MVKRKTRSTDPGEGRSDGLCERAHTALDLHVVRTPRPHSPVIATLLDTHISLPDGSRVRLRLPHARDRHGVVDLFARVGVAAHALDLHRALRFDPRKRAVVCASRWTPAGESVVGVAAIDFGADQADLLLTDEASAPGLGAALHAMLTGVAAQRRAA